MKPAPLRPRLWTMPFIVAIHFYRAAISPLIGPACRFEPTCSVYAEEAVVRFGVWKGVLLALRRILRCHPFARGGLDPVPSPSHSAVRAKST
jgi:uncharacterized protein